MLAVQLYAKAAESTPTEMNMTSVCLSVDDRPVRSPLLALKTSCRCLSVAEAVMKITQFVSMCALCVILMTPVCKPDFTFCVLILGKQQIKATIINQSHEVFVKAVACIKKLQRIIT